jgi:hypothetical protein
MRFSAVAFGLIAGIFNVLIIGAANAAGCRPGNPCFEGWIAAQDVGVSRSFFRAGGTPLQASQIAPGMEVETAIELWVRYSPAGWGGRRYMLPKRSKVQIARVGTLAIERYATTQRWVYFRTPMAQEVALSPKLWPAALPQQPASGTAPLPEGVWWERPVAEITGGYDGPNNRTMIHSYNLVVRGPSTVEAAIKPVIEGCIGIAGGSGYAAFKSTPSPEIGVRMGAAWGAFKASLASCFSTKSIQKELIDQFELGYMRRVRYEDGLHARFSMSNPSTELYSKLHDLVKDKVPEPINRFIQFAISTQDFPEIDIKLQPPAILRNFSAEIPDAEQLQKMSDAYNKAKDKNWPALAKLVEDEIKNQAQNWAKGAGGKVEEAVRGALVKLPAAIGDQIKSIEPSAAAAKLFSQLVDPTKLPEGPLKDAACRYVGIACNGGDGGGGETGTDCILNYLACGGGLSPPFSLSVAEKIDLPTPSDYVSKARQISISTKLDVLSCGRKGCSWVTEITQQ